MRDIRFRALTQEGNIICDIGCIEFFEDGIIVVNDEIPVKELMQYTGLKDKNGKEIYEGDIVSGFGNRMIVFYNELRAMFALDYITDYPRMNLPSRQTSPNDDWCEYEVIGTIHENPTLIEEK